MELKNKINQFLRFFNVDVPAHRIFNFFRMIGRKIFFFDKKMIKHYTEFVHKGDLVFDLGANIGNRTEIFLKLGAGKVISVEPTTQVMNILKKKFGSNKKVVLLKNGISSKKEILEINVCSETEFSTFEKEELEEVKKNRYLKHLRWENKEKINMISLNDLIQEYGLPDFVKIDIEGSEAKALSTLKYAIPSLSFEYHTNFKDKILKCIDYLSRVGEYEFNYSEEENLSFVLKNWCDEKKIKEEMSKKEKNLWGDIYCRKTKKFSKK